MYQVEVAGLWNEKVTETAETRLPSSGLNQRESEEMISALSGI
jgi:hypothetical protein